MLHHCLTVLYANLHTVFIGLALVLLTSLAVSALIVPLLVHSLSGEGEGAGSLPKDDTVLLVTHPTILQGELVDYNGFPLVWQTRSLSVDVFIVSVSDDLAVGQLDLAS